MSTWFLYGLTVLIWGSTWFAIKLQLGVVDPMASIAHRFAVAALLLFLFLKVRRVSLRLEGRHHLFLLLQGLCLFSGNYYFVYHAELELASGLVAVVFATIMLANVINSAIFLGNPINAKVVAGGLVGLVGMGVVFWPELTAFNFSDANFVALLYCLAGTLLASFGNIIAARNKLHDMPLLVTNTWAMSYGAVSMYGAALLTGAAISVDWTPAYLLSLLYLSVFGSVVAFWAYLTLVGNIGPDRAGYANLLFPLVALAISTMLEGYQWTVAAVLGLALVLIGNFVVMRAQRSA